VSVRTEAAFSVLVGLDPLRGEPAREQVTWRSDPVDPADGNAEACLARIIATPRLSAAAAPARPGSQWAGAGPPRRAHYGAVGLVASAAIAAITTLLWASPSAGSPPDQALTAPAPVGQVHSPPQT
jgi:hypothetical protein